MSTPPVVLLFPGQGAQYPGLLDRLLPLDPRIPELVREASEVLGRDLSARHRSSEPYARNLDIQVGVFLANHLFLTLLQARGVDGELSAGLSLGEYNHLVHIGALTFADALRAVQQRGLAYDEGPPGAMAAVFPVDLELLWEVIEQVREAGRLEVSNLNSPTSYVLSGDMAAIERATPILEEEHLARVVVIERRVPMHSSLFEPVGRRFRAVLEQLPFRAPRLPYLPNRLGRVLPDPGPSDFVELLATHVHRPVLWRQTIDHVIGLHPDAVFVEVGPKAVLCGLLRKKWVRNERYPLDDEGELAPHLDRVAARLLDR